MFMDLERIMPGGVRVVSIEPQQVKGHVEVKLTVGASSDEAKLKFLRALEASNNSAELNWAANTRPPRAANDQKLVELTTIYSRS